MVVVFRYICHHFKNQKYYFMEEFLQLLLYERNALATFLGQVRHFKMASDLPQNGKNVGMLVFEKQWLQLSLGHS